MATVTHAVDDEEFGEPGEMIVGRAVYDLTIENDFSADIGGVDGLDCTNVELVSVKVGALELNRYQMVEATSEAQIEAMEEALAEKVNECPEDYV